MKNIYNINNLYNLLDYVSDGIQIFDQNAKLIYCNKKASQVDDINIELSLGKSILEIYPSLSEETSTLLEVIKTGKPIIDKEQTFTTYRGSVITTINTTLPIYDKENIFGAVEISRNITDIKELSEKYVDLKTKVYSNKKIKISDIDTSKYIFDDIVTKNIDFEKLKKHALKAANLEIPILISGETGTGKELLVHSIHSESKRKNNSFIAQNCAALPLGLLEGILFGSVKGGFTGAANRKGLFEIADGGTLFLDELNSMPLELQGKLLRVIQDGVVRRVGDIKTRKVDVRIIAALNIDPFTAMNSNLLRKDLYFRLSTLSLNIPPLRERKEDIPILIKHFINKFNKKFNKNILGVVKETEKLFIEYNWPGNVRELEHVIESAVSMTENRYVNNEFLPKNLEKFAKELLVDEKYKHEYSLKKVIEKTEKNMIEKIFKESMGNVTTSSKVLGIPRQTLQYKIKKYKIKL
ncbi:sigma-54 interaction domain-containing protein [Helicovermis profundi]|uniref:Arginine utilization transcriptional regulator RocR n=1 Tax=Helicovermis profundi TaxID=3065157 RepID=A0AAU9EB38_9FIRM|nr:arginine utilization transcriptional regulator RocR [Clostridia bacterium S502]